MAERFTCPAGSYTAAATPHALKSSVCDPSRASNSSLRDRTLEKRSVSCSLPRATLCVIRNRGTITIPTEGQSNFEH